MGERRERNEGGWFKPEYTDEKLLEAVRTHEPAGTNKVADGLGVARQSADYCLRSLLDGGRVSKKRVGNSLVRSVEQE